MTLGEGGGRVGAAGTGGMPRAVEWSLAVLAGAAFGALWLAAVFAGEVSNFAALDHLLVFWAVAIIPAVLAAKVLIHRVRLTGDGPDRLFTVAAGLMPAHREDWVAAMRAELAHVPGNAARWAFAAGCVRAALIPRAGLAPVVAAALAAVTAAYTLPVVTVFAATFVGVVVLTTPVSSPRLPTVTGFAGLLGVAACVTAVTYLVFTYPASMATALGPDTAIILALVLAGCARLALAPPRALAGGRAVRAVAVLTTVVFCAGFVLVSRLPGDEGSGMMGYLMFPPMALFLVGAGVAAAGRSFRAGALAATWTILLCTTWVYVLWLVESVRWDHNGFGLLLDAEGGLNMSFNLKDSVVWVATWLPVWALPLGLLGAAAGARLRRR